ncbi:MAG: ABC transporter ATP-binding protein [Hyphomicrobiales bacterium]|nr:MAG: ABC transporter ATP-binding protein [Hyphomicrobiales bacterium]
MTLELKKITKRVDGEDHIYETSLSFAEYGFNVLLGTTLSGKTTLMRLMAGLIHPSSGEIWFNGRNVTGVPVQKRNVSMVYQQFINYPNFSVFDNIASPLKLARMSKADIRKRVIDIADLLQLTPMLERSPSELSGGQQQRTALARALVKDADLVLLDEPLANLDFKLREELRDELPKLFADRNCTVIYATTEPTEALLLGGHTATLHEGHVAEYAPTGELYRNPSSLVSAKVFSEPPINTARITKKGGEFQMEPNITWPAKGALASLRDGTYLLGLRAHHIAPEPTGSESVPVRGKVLVSELSGSETVIHMDIGPQSWVSQLSGIHFYDIGHHATLHADMSRAMLFTESGERVAA